MNIFIMHAPSIAVFGTVTDADAPSCETSSDFTDKEITFIAESWSQSAEELGRVLSICEQSSKCTILKKQKGDKRRQLAEVFEKNEYHNVAGIILHELPDLPSQSCCFYLPSSSSSSDVLS